jgi:predicted dehydrogenase
MALEYGFNVLIDKPTLSLDEAKHLQRKVKKLALFCLSHTYSGYPMVKQARKMVAENQFGNIRKVMVEYPQGWLSTLTERRKQTSSLEN